MEFKKVKKSRPVQPTAHRQEQHTATDAVLIKKQRMPLTRTVKRVLWATAAAIAVTVIVAIIYSVISTRLASSPSFQAILPSNTSINALGGWTRVSPPDQPQVFSYSDSIDDVTIRVSEQVLPTSSTVADIAKGYNATDKITAGKQTVYIGNNFKGYQSVIFSKSGLLILIGSTAKISNDSWSNYIESLQ